MKEYDSSSPLIFIHIPKAAGSSVQQIFKLWYGDSLHYHYFNEQTSALPEKLVLDSLQPTSRPMVLYGHFNMLRGFGVEDYYPEVNQFITILRNPFEGAISSYYYIRSAGTAWQDQTYVPATDLRQYLREAPVHMLNHFPRQVTKENYRELIEEFFVYIGIMEDLSESVRWIAHKLGKPFKPDWLPHVNMTPRDQDYPDDLLDEFRHMHSLEFEVYDYVASKFTPSS